MESHIWVQRRYYKRKEKHFISEGRGRSHNEGLLIPYYIWKENCLPVRPGTLQIKSVVYL